VNARLKDEVLRIPVGSAKETVSFSGIGVFMRNVVFTAVSIFAMSLASAVYADEQTAPPPGTTSTTSTTTTTTTTVAAKDPGEVQCKRFKVTGELIPGPKICHTRAEWEEIQRQSQMELERAQGVGTAPSSK
jgi:hypothetical protein